MFASSLISSTIVEFTTQSLVLNCVYSGSDTPIDNGQWIFNSNSFSRSLICTCVANVTIIPYLSKPELVAWFACRNQTINKISWKPDAPSVSKDFFSESTAYLFFHFTVYLWPYRVVLNLDYWAPMVAQPTLLENNDDLEIDGPDTATYSHLGQVTRPTYCNVRNPPNLIQ
ncbi:hypothetical protein SprV_0200554700 [Sparganum proliferum]